jgi:hypothetical protein
LLPPYLVGPMVANREPCLDLVDDIAKEFDTSIPATAIRIARQAPGPAAVVVHSHEGRDWSFPNLAWPSEILFANQVHHDSPAMDLLFVAASGTKTRDTKEPGSRWLYGNGAYRLEVRVQSIKRQGDQILSLVRICAR